ncbi:MAG: phosphoribosylformylglycinamidine synthase II, partial [Rhodospirillales bacterium]
SFEMASKGGLGIELDLDRVPIRETGMTAYEMLLSESQERMLMVLKPGREGVAEATFRKWELDFAVIGRTTDTGRMVATHQGSVVVDVPIDPLAKASPDYDRPVATPPRPAPLDPAAIPVPDDPMAALVTLLGSPDLASKRWVWEQYDHMVMADTVQRPGGDAAVVRVHGTAKGLAMSCDCTPRYCLADPVEGGRQAVAEAWRNLTAVGARPLAITDCLNFGSPERPAIMGQFAGCIRGMAEACTELAFPVVSGNVSFYNETNGTGIPPTPTIGGLGLIDDLDRMAVPAFRAADEAIILVGGEAEPTGGWLGQSLFLREITGLEAGPPPPVDLAAERRTGDFVRALIAGGRVGTCHDVADGGLLVAVAEMALAGGIGASLSAPASVAKLLAWLFGEDQGRYLVTVPTEDVADLMRDAAAASVAATVIGRTGGDRLTLGAAHAISLGALREAHEPWLPGFMATSAARPG